MGLAEHGVPHLLSPLHRHLFDHHVELRVDVGERPEDERANLAEFVQPLLERTHPLRAVELVARADLILI